MKISKIQNINFQSTLKHNDKSDTEKSIPKSENDKTTLTLLGLAVGGALAVLLGQKSKMSFEKALLKEGVKIKDGIAIIQETGKKYTGTIKRKVNAYGMKREIVTYKDGLITEKLYKDILGRELEGHFYKEGKPYLTIWKDAKKGNRFKIRYDNEMILDNNKYIEAESGFNWARTQLEK